ncbi:MAG: FHA domain-containing protein [Deltaproteobacteria bacterium]|nr:FHA domain-containing protein [Deltaproteobacteria bacterium]
MKFDIIHKGELVETRDLGPGSYKIGRSPDCDLQLKSAQISKQHALLVIKDNKAAIVDLGSSNGIFVNGILVKKHRFQAGDEIAIADYKIRLSSPIKTKHTAPVSPDMGNLAPALYAEETAVPETPAVQMSVQERLVLLSDQWLVKPLYSLMLSFDWRVLLAAVLVSAFVLTVLVSAWPVLRWGKHIATTESLARGRVILKQVVRDNHRILSKTGDFSLLTVESAEAEQGVLSCVIVDPKSSTILAPTRLFNKTISDTYSQIAVRRILEGQEEDVSVETNAGTYLLAQPIAVYSKELNDRVLSAIVLAEFKPSNEVYSVYNSLAEAILLAILLSLIGYFVIYKIFTYPILRLQEQLDAALKGENVNVSCEAKCPELQSLSTIINFSVSRWRQMGGTQPAVGAENLEEEDAAYIKTIAEMDAGFSDGILLMDKDKKVRFVGQVLEELLSMRNQYAAGQNISEACRDPSFAGTAIDLADRVSQALGAAQFATMDINGVSRNMAAIGHKSSSGELRFILITVKMNG